MLDLAIDTNRLSGIVTDAFNRPCRLTPLNVQCTYPVYRGEVDSVGPVFVKIATRDEQSRTVRLLSDIGECPFVPRLLTDQSLAYDDYAVLVMEWKAADVVFPEDMNAAQITSFVHACRTLSASLQKAKEFAPIADSPYNPERLYSVVSAYVRRHPFAGRLLRCLVELPVERRTFGERPLFVLHGDFHAKNFGFTGDEFARVIDFDQLTEGLACGDLANAIVERFSCFHLKGEARRRLCDNARWIVEISGWSMEEFEISCNIQRLRFAARRIEKHPDSPLTAIDIRRRDRRIQQFLTCL